MSQCSPGWLFYRCCWVACGQCASQAYRLMRGWSHRCWTSGCCFRPYSSLYLCLSTGRSTLWHLSVIFSRSPQRDHISLHSLALIYRPPFADSSSQSTTAEFTVIRHQKSLSYPAIWSRPSADCFSKQSGRTVSFWDSTLYDSSSLAPYGSVLCEVTFSDEESIWPSASAWRSGERPWLRSSHTSTDNWYYPSSVLCTHWSQSWGTVCLAPESLCWGTLWAWGRRNQDSPPQFAQSVWRVDS